MGAVDSLAALIRGMDGRADGLERSVASTHLGTVDSVGVGATQVTLDGMEEPTPCTMAVAAKAGDRVMVEVAGNAARIVGNLTEPPTGDGTALEALQLAGEAADVANATDQHFWHRSTDDAQDGAGTGAFLTDMGKDDFLEAAADGFSDASDNKPYNNILLNSLGMLLRSAKNNLVSLSRSATTFFDGLGNSASNVVAYFGRDGSRIGKTGESRVEIDYHSLKMVDKNDNTYFEVKDLRDEQGVAQLVEKFDGDGSTTSFVFDIDAIDTDYAVTVSDGSGGTVTKTRYSFTFSTPPSDGATITATYETSSFLAKSYTAGIRLSNATAGAVSWSEGLYNTSSAVVSHSEGLLTKADGICSHSEGRLTEAIGYASHAEGSVTRAVGYGAHAEGEGSVANGYASHAGGAGTVAGHDAQTAIGKFNDNKPGNLFEVGNGTEDDARSNAFEVTWTGDTVIPGTAYSRHARRDMPQYTKAGSNIPQTQWYDGHELVYDQTGEQVWYSSMSRSTGDVLYKSFVLRRLKSDGTAVTNGYYIQIDASGNPVIAWAGSDTKQAWRTALGISADVDWTELTLDSGVQLYDSNVNNVPRYCKRCGIVNVLGAVKPRTQVVSGGSLTIGRLPDGCRPKGIVSVMCQGSGSNIWQLRIGVDGVLGAYAYRSGGTNAAMSTTAWLIFNATFAAA